MINSLNSVSSLSLYLIVGPVESCCRVSKTDFVNSGSYLRTVFVFISGITTFTGLAGTAGFFASGLGAGDGGGVTADAVLPATGGWAAVLAGAWRGCVLIGDDWAFVGCAAVFTAGLDILDTA